MDDYDLQVLIDRHLDFYQSLDDGSRTPNTEAQEHFVRVCRGDLPSKTDHELAYMAFRRHEMKQQKKPEDKPPQRQLKKPVPRQFAKPRPSTGRAVGTKPIATPDWKRFIDEPLGTREDFKKDSSNNRDRSRRQK